MRHASSGRVVDVWAQPGTTQFLENVPEVARLLIQSRSPIEKLVDIGPKGLAALMEEANMDKILLSAWRRPGKVVLSNETIKEFTTYDPTKFIGIGTVDLAHPMDAVATLEKCVKVYGFKGIRILPWLWDKPPTYNWYYPIFAKCIELDVPFCTQVGITGPLCPSEPGRPIPYIDQVALDFPDLVIIGGHIGYPWTNEMISMAWKHANVYIDTSAHAPKYYPNELIHFMNSYGSRKVMFGTNYPQLMLKTCVEQAKELPLTEKAMENFMWKNADRVFKLDMDK